MAERKDISEGSTSSLTTVTSGSSQNANALSSEDLVWVDSCLTDASEASGGNLDRLRDVIDDYPEMFFTSSTSLFSTKEDDLVVSSPETEEDRQRTDNNLFTPSHGEAITLESSSLTEEVSEVLALLNFHEDPSKNSLQDDFLSEHEYSRAENKTHNPLDSDNAPDEMEGLENGTASDEEADSLLSKVSKDDLSGTSVQEIIMPNDNADDFFDSSYVSEDLIEISSKDIFKVWDLEIPADDSEEDEFEQQLKQVFCWTSSKQALSRPEDDPDVLKDGLMDNLITGISDLSLTKTPT